MNIIKSFFIPKLPSLALNYTSRLLFFVLILCLVVPRDVYSFSLKEIKVKSSFGDKFYAEVLVSNNSKKGLKAFVGTPRDYALLRVKRSTVVNELRIIEPIEFVSADQQLIRIVSDKPLFYPSFDLIIKATLEGGTILEKYSLAVDFKKNMSIGLLPSDLAKKALSQKKAETPKQIKKKIVHPPSPKVEEPVKPKVAATREIKEPIAVKGPRVSSENKTEKEVVKKKPPKLKKAQTPIDKGRTAVNVPKTTAKKPDPTHKKSFPKNILVYEIARGDTLSRILKKRRPQKSGFHKALVALWKLNKEKFLFNNMNGLEVGTHLSFDNLEKEINKISINETKQILRDQWEEWKNIRAGIRVDTGSDLAVSPLPLPGENVNVTDNILKALSGWKQSWENEDMAKHFSYYSDKFSSENYIRKNIDLAGWKKYKVRLMRKNKNIRIDIKNLHIRKEGSQVITSFLQKFSSDKLISFGTKNITFVKEGEQWKIKKELFRKKKTEILSSNFPFVVQTSSHRNGLSAMKSVNTLRKAGFAAYLVKSAGGKKGLRFRVVTGRFRTKTEAYRSSVKLIRSKGIKHASVQKLPYAISLGSLKNETEAYQLIQNFRKNKYSLYLFSVGNEKEITHHVLVGGYKNKKQANAVSQKLLKEGIPHTVIQP